MSYEMSLLLLDNDEAAFQFNSNTYIYLLLPHVTQSTARPKVSPHPGWGPDIFPVVSFTVITSCLLTLPLGLCTNIFFNRQHITLLVVTLRQMYTLFSHY